MPDPDQIVRDVVSNIKNGGICKHFLQLFGKDGPGWLLASRILLISQELELALIARHLFSHNLALAASIAGTAAFQLVMPAK